MEVGSADEGRPDGDDGREGCGQAKGTPEFPSMVQVAESDKQQSECSSNEKTATLKNDICERVDATINTEGSVIKNARKGHSADKKVSVKPDCDNNGRSSDVGLEFLDPNDSGLNGKRRRHRRKQKGGKHHRKWKPYDKLTWDERKTLEERECRRACQKRENRFASGQAMAPYNTTQFLMEQHEPEESELHLNENRPMRERVMSRDHHIQGTDISAPVGSGGSGEGSSDEYYDSNEEEIFLEKDFTEAYEQYQAERLQSMTKDELVKEYLGLETEVEVLKRQLKDLENVNRRSSSGSGHSCSLQSPDLSDSAHRPVSDLYLEIEKLRAENKLLATENDRLKCTNENPKNQSDTDVPCGMEVHV